jgi:hypothetical protein
MIYTVDTEHYRISHGDISILPSDFDLFGKIKSAPIGQEIDDEIDLFEAVNETVNGIPDAEFQRVFRSWIERVERMIDGGGNHRVSIKSPEDQPRSLQRCSSLRLKHCEVHETLLGSERDPARIWRANG